MDETPASSEASEDGMDPRLWFVFMAGVVIAAMCLWRAMTPRLPAAVSELPELKQPAPTFQLYDQSSELVKLDAYLHRHTIVVVFFNGQAGPEADASLVELRKFFPALKQEGIAVFGVSTALPQENRRNSTQPFPFPLLSDADATSAKSAHRTWGCFIEPPTLDKPAGTKPGIFIINRAGLVRWNGAQNCPSPEPETVGIVARLLRET